MIETTEVVSHLEGEQAPMKTVSVVIIKGGEVLTVRHRAGTTAGEGVTGFPGGKLKNGETEREAAVRELEEETGLVADQDSLLEFPENVFYARLNGTRAQMRVFLCNSAEGDLVGDTMRTRPEWVPLAKINQGLFETMPNVLEALDKAQHYFKPE